MDRRTFLILPFAPAAHAVEASAPAAPFAGLDRTISTEFTDVESVVVVRDNTILFEHYNTDGPDALRRVESVTKSVLSLAIGAALHTGALRSLDQSVPEAVARSVALPPHAAALPLTFRHLLSMTAGFAPTGRVTRQQSDDPVFLLDRPRAAEPGAQFLYDNHASNLLACALELAIGSPLPQFAHQRLFEPLRVQMPEWATGPHQHAYGAAGLKLRTRDMASLGQLMLEGGAWHGNQLLPASFVAEAITPRSPGGAPVGLPYGLGWWVAPSRQTYFASGFGGQFIWVHAPLRLSIAVTSDVSEASHARGQALALIRQQLFKAASQWRPA